MVVESDQGRVTREVTVLHDGREGWLIQGGDQTEVTFSSLSTLLVREVDGLTSVQGKRTAVNGWAKSLFNGALLNLEGADGDVRGEAVACGRPCIVVEVRGLRSDRPRVPFLLTVDTEDGIIMKLERPGSALLLEVTSLETATPLV